VENFLNVIDYLLTTDLQDIETIKELICATYSICLSAQENDDHLAQILEINFSLINQIMKDIIPKYKQHKIILFHCIKIIGLLLTGYDTTVEVIFFQFFATKKFYLI